MSEPTQPEPIRAWVIESFDEYLSPTYHVILGTVQDARNYANAAALTCDGVCIEGPYEFTIAVKP